MRRNETVLVYAVTGLLIVILGIAVIFGEESARASKSGESAKVDGERRDGQGLLEETNAEDLGMTPAAKVPAGEEEKPPAGEPTVDPTVKPTVDPAVDPAVKTSDAVAGDLKQPITSDVTEDDPGGPVPLVTPTVHDRVIRVLGTSKRDGQYRIVTARQDDRLSTLVERWCGGLDALPTVEALNEDLKAGKPIPGGRQVLVPWTDDEVLLEALKERRQKAAEIERKQGELYTLKRGESLWKIAVNKVGSRKAPAYIQAIVKRNPELEDPDTVREGQKIRLPPVATPVR
ncbi:MAG: LysM peptidoglycan-binding domain-containing protein [Planctomycetota bacterium]|jgi:hypothetical protein